jgi:hypothetical protein
MSWRRGAVLLSTLVAAASAGACTQSCTDIGGESGITVALNHALPTQAVTVEACVRETCRSVVANGIEGPEQRVNVPNPALTSEKQVPVTISITGGNGEVLVPRATTAVTPNRKQPNGPRCAPVFYNAVVTVSPTP